MVLFLAHTHVGACLLSPFALSIDLYAVYYRVIICHKFGFGGVRLLATVQS